jgi:hypothetical protein
MRRRRAIQAGALAVAGATGALAVDRTVLRDGPRSVTGRVGVRNDAESPLELSIHVRKSTIAEGSPALVEFAVTNHGGSAAEYVTGTPAPFGVLYAERTLLWTDAYEADPGTRTEGKRVVGGTDGGPTVTVPAGESRTETYEFDAVTGEYVVNRTGNPFEVDGVVYAPELTVTRG